MGLMGVQKMNNFKDILNSVLQFFPKLFKLLFGSKQDKIRNKHLFKRGGYAIAFICTINKVSKLGFIPQRRFGIKKEKKDGR